MKPFEGGKKKSLCNSEHFSSQEAASCNLQCQSSAVSLGKGLPYALHLYPIHIPFISHMFPPAGTAKKRGLRKLRDGFIEGCLPCHLGNHSHWECWCLALLLTLHRLQGAGELQPPLALQCCCFASWSLIDFLN